MHLFQFQQLSLAVHRYNSVDFSGTFLVPHRIGLVSLQLTVFVIFVLTPGTFATRGLKNTCNNNPLLMRLSVTVRTDNIRHTRTEAYNQACVAICY